MKSIGRHAWLLLFAVGAALALFAYDNVVVIPGLDPSDPDRGWAWLTTNPEVIDYIKGWFRNFGLSVLALSIFVMVTAAGGFRRGERWAWFSLLYLPVHIGIHMILWPWTIPVLSIMLLMTLAGLILPYRAFFPARRGVSLPA